MKIGIIIGSIRKIRHTELVAEYVNTHAQKRETDFTYQLIDLAKFDVPLLTSPVHPMVSNKKYDDERVQNWSDVIDSCEGFIFVTPEYNHGVPGGFKNAVDTLGAEWVGKPVAFAGHGSVGGVRAIEQWRQILANFSMPNARAELNFNGFLHFKEGTFVPEDRHIQETEALFDQLEELVKLYRS